MFAYLDNVTQIRIKIKSASAFAPVAILAKLIFNRGLFAGHGSEMHGPRMFGSFENIIKASWDDVATFLIWIVLPSDRISRGGGRLLTLGMSIELRGRYSCSPTDNPCVISNLGIK